LLHYLILECCSSDKHAHERRFEIAANGRAAHDALARVRAAHCVGAARAQTSATTGVYTSITVDASVCTDVSNRQYFESSIGWSPTTTNIGNYLARLFWPKPAAPSADEVRATALAELRESQRILRARAADKKRRLGDVNATIVALGLRMEKRKLLAPTDADEFRVARRQRAMLERSHRDFLDMISNIDGLIEQLGDAPALEHSFQSMAASSAARQHHIDETLAALEATRAGIAELEAAHKAFYARLKTEEHKSAADASSELEALMADGGFIGQFDPDELARVRLQMLSAPTVPRDAPVRDATRELGLLTA
jgi:hypothetical protein